MKVKYCTPPGRNILFVCALILAILSEPVSGQINSQKGIKMLAESQWWYPLIKDLGVPAENCISSEYLCFVGGSITKRNDEIISENALILIRKGVDEYQVLKSDHATFNIKGDILRCGKGTLKTYKFSSPGKNPVGGGSFANLTIHFTDENK